MSRRVSRKRSRRATPKRVRPPRPKDRKPAQPQRPDPGSEWSEELGRWLSNEECEAIIAEAIESVGEVDAERRRERANKLHEEFMRKHQT